MLIHGRLLVTQNCLMLDEVRSLLQKSLRRKETDLAYRATRELIGPQKDQLPWKSIVTFMFEDHCLSHVDVLKQLYDFYTHKNKFKCIELLDKCFTCRHAACLQVVVLGDRYRPDADLWTKDIPIPSEIKGLVSIKKGGIDIDVLLALIIKHWQEKDTKALTTLFGLVNMSEKVEKRSITQAGVKYLLDSNAKKPTLYHLVLSILYKHTTDSYMKAVVLVCFKFVAMVDVPQGLIMFSVLSQLIFKDKILNKPIPDMKEIGKIQWTAVPKLESMPSWAVDKHTYRGKFGRSSENVFKKQIKRNPFSEEELREFHGERPKADIKIFFDIGCICNNDILEENPIWDEAKEMYLKQKPSQQKCRKMTIYYYHEMKKNKNAIFPQGEVDSSDEEPKVVVSRKRKAVKNKDSGEKSNKRMKKEQVIEHTSKETKDSSNKPGQSAMVASSTWPLLQLPTGSGKVYTKLDREKNLVWKGPYQSKPRQNLCLFFHRVMKDVFRDKHTLDIEQRGQYVVFPLIKSENSEPKVTKRAFYDCIAKQHMTEDEGQFVERSSLGIVQLHKISIEKVATIPLSVWTHFAYRFALNIGDTGLYNIIATDNLKTIYGIDMEERRGQVKGNYVMHMLFGKLPRKEIAAQIEMVLRRNINEFIDIVTEETDYDNIDRLCQEYGLEEHGQRCKQRILQIQEAVMKLQ